MTVHSFQKSLARSNEFSNASWWREVYEQAFPDLESMVCVRDDGWAQRGGIDRVLTLSSGKTLYVDEKVREKNYPDILLEFYSDRDRKIPGWVAKDLASDFIAYAFIPSRTCYLLPFQTLRRVWRQNYSAWVSNGMASAGGFRIVDAQNQSYVTRSVAVPIDTLFAAMTEAMAVTWRPAA